MKRLFPNRLMSILSRAMSLADGQPPMQCTAPNCAEQWEKQYLAPVIPVKSLTHPVAVEIAKLTLPGDVLLETGCGSARISAELATVGRKIELCDFSEPILERATEVFR